MYQSNLLTSFLRFISFFILVLSYTSCLPIKTQESLFRPIALTSVGDYAIENADENQQDTDFLFEESVQEDAPVQATALMQAAARGDLDTVTELIIQETHDFDNALSQAAMYGRIEVVKVLCSKATDSGLYYALLRAAEENRIDVVKELKNKVKKGKHRNQALLSAAENGHTDVVKELKDSATNIDQALLSAAEKGYAGVVRKLKHRAPAAYIDDALDIAVKKRDTKVVKELRYQASKIHLPLLKAAWYAHTPVFQLLLSRAGDVTDELYDTSWNSYLAIILFGLSKTMRTVGILQY